jgi:hypothetical protein
MTVNSDQQVAGDSLALEELADQAGVEPGYVRRLVESGALEEASGSKAYRSSGLALLG